MNVFRRVCEGIAFCVIGGTLGIVALSADKEAWAVFGGCMLMLATFIGICSLYIRYGDD